MVTAGCRQGSVTSFWGSDRNLHPLLRSPWSHTIGWEYFTQIQDAPKFLRSTAPQLLRQADGILSSMSDFLLLGQAKSHLVHFIFCDCTLARGIPELDRRFCWIPFPSSWGASCCSGWAVKESCEQTPRKSAAVNPNSAHPPSATPPPQANSASTSAIHKAETFSEQ